MGPGTTGRPVGSYGPSPPSDLQVRPPMPTVPRAHRPPRPPCPPSPSAHRPPMPPCPPRHRASGSAPHAAAGTELRAVRAVDARPLTSLRSHSPPQSWVLADRKPPAADTGALVPGLRCTSPVHRRLPETGSQSRNPPPSRAGPGGPPPPAPTSPSMDPPRVSVGRLRRGAGPLCGQALCSPAPSGPSRPHGDPPPRPVTPEGRNHSFRLLPAQNSDRRQLPARGQPTALRTRAWALPRHTLGLTRLLGPAGPHLPVCPWPPACFHL